MYSNIGGKIKVLAKVIAIIETVASVILALSMLEGSDGVSLVLLLIGPVFAWISSWTLYAFGELVENSTTLTEMKLEEESRRMQQNQPAAAYNQTPYNTQRYTPPVYQPPQPYQSANTQTFDAVQNQAASVGHEWRCTCGRVHAAYVSTCPCGVNKRDIKI